MQKLIETRIHIEINKQSEQFRQQNTIFSPTNLLFHVSSFTVYYINALVIKAEDRLYSKANACSKICMNVLTLHVSSSTIYCMNALLFHVLSFTIYYMNALVIKANNPLYSRANACCKHLFYIS